MGKRLEQTFKERRNGDGRECVKRCLTPDTMPVKANDETLLAYLLEPNPNITTLYELSVFAGRNDKDATLWTTLEQLLTKLVILLLYNLAFILIGIYPLGYKLMFIHTHKNLPMNVYSSFICNFQIPEQARYP
jgi:hypothetical protein